MPGPLLRRGPRPLMLHLMLAWMRSSASIAGSPNWSGAWLDGSMPTAWLEPLVQNGWSSPENLPLEHPESSVAAFRAALQHAMQNDSAMVAGIASYRRHPSCRVQPDPPQIWAEGEARLLDYAPGSTGRTVLFVPSLINRGYILDLAPGHSLLRFLANNGIRPLLLDWGWPGTSERLYTLTDYVAGVLERAIAAVGQKVTLAGYCMGGLLAIAAAQRRPDLVGSLAVLATPWDFRVHDTEQSDAIGRLMPLLQPLLQTGNTLPIDALQTLFAMLDPEAVAVKFRRFGGLDQDSPRARLFVAIEDWANDGVPLAAAVARECFTGWYGANLPMLGEWRVAGMKVIPASLHVPCFLAVPGRDRIVPPESAWPLARHLPHAQIIEPASGHISMVAGVGAENALWRPLLTWLQAL